MTGKVMKDGTMIDGTMTDKVMTDGTMIDGTMTDKVMTDGTMKYETRTGRTAVIIGGGMGGLITGAMLSRSGWRVTVLEKNRNVGGGLQTFRRGGADFCPGMHLVGGVGGGAAATLLRRLGVELRLENCDMTVVVPEPAGGEKLSGYGCGSAAGPEGYAGEVREYHIPQGAEAFHAYLSEQFPGSAAELRRYLDRMQEIYDSVPLLRIGSDGPDLSPGLNPDSMPSDGLMVSYIPEGDALMPADGFVAKYVSDPRLRRLLGWLSPLEGVIPGVTPAYVHAIINILYIRGTSQFVGGAKPVSEQLIRIIESSGGAVRAGCAATEVLVDKAVTGVRASDGNVYAADIYISDIHPSAFAALCPPDAFPKAFRRRLALQKPGISMFCLYIKLKEEGQDVSPGVAKFIMDGDSAWQPWGEVMYVREGNAVTVMAPMSCEEVARWKGTASCKRPEEYGQEPAGHPEEYGQEPAERTEEYGQWLAERTELLLNRIERAEPGFRSRIEGCWPASPLTLARYLGDPDGAAYGFRIDSSSPLHSRFGPRTYLSNLYMTGQSVFLHGFCGVTMSSVMTVKTIMND